MKKLLLITVLSLTLVACSNSTSNNTYKVVTLDSEVLTVNCDNYSYISEDRGYTPYVRINKVSRAVKDYCLSKVR